MSWGVLAAALAALGGVLAGLLSPRELGWLREPVQEAPGPPRPSKREVPETPGLARRLHLHGAESCAVDGWEVGWTPVLGAWTYLNAVCLLLGYVDARTRLLPTQLIAPSYVVIVALLLLAGAADHSVDGLSTAFQGWLVMGGFYFVMWRVGPPGLGYGDVRLSGLLALCLGYLGWGELITGLYAGFLLGGLGSVVLVLARRITLKTHIPFGPFMILGALTGLIWGETLAHWYSSR